MGAWQQRWAKITAPCSNPPLLQGNIQAYQISALNVIQLKWMNKCSTFPLVVTLCEGKNQLEVPSWFPWPWLSDTARTCQRSLSCQLEVNKETGLRNSLKVVWIRTTEVHLAVKLFVFSLWIYADARPLPAAGILITHTAGLKWNTAALIVPLIYLFSL